MQILNLNNSYSSNIQKNQQSFSGRRTFNQDVKPFACSARDSFNLSFCASKSMKRLRQMIKDEKRKEKQASRKKEDQQKETERIFKPLSAELATRLELSSNPFRSDISEGKKLGIAIAYNLRNDPTETLVIVDNTGKVLARSGGGKSSTGVLYSGDNYKSCISIHNHPVNAPFSADDIYSMIDMKIKESIVGTAEGYYSMIIPEDNDKEQAFNAVKEVKTKYEIYRTELKEKVKQKQLQEEEANKRLYSYIDALWKQVAKEMHWEYTFKRWN